jgi:biopolymer transport protein TolR
MLNRRPISFNIQHSTPNISEVVSKFSITQRTGGTLSEINLIPLVDLIFNLLIIFMIVAPMIHKGIEVKLPSSAVGESVSDQKRHIITITKEGALWFDNQETTLEQLQSQLQKVLPDEILYIRADKSVPYGYVVDVITAIKANGIRNVGLVTNPVSKK